MYLVAQRVRVGPDEGINAFLHHHGERLGWVHQVPPGIPDSDPGELDPSRSRVVVRGPGRVVSYLDVAAPDGSMSAESLGWVHDAVVALCSVRVVLPITASSGAWMVRFFVGTELAAGWHDELHVLLDEARSLLST